LKIEDLSKYKERSLKVKAKNSTRQRQVSPPKADKVREA
jgi:hypothetical protein